MQAHWLECTQFSHPMESFRNSQFEWGFSLVQIFREFQYTSSINCNALISTLYFTLKEKILRLTLWMQAHWVEGFVCVSVFIDELPNECTSLIQFGFVESKDHWSLHTWIIEPIFTTWDILPYMKKLTTVIYPLGFNQLALSYTSTVTRVNEFSLLFIINMALHATFRWMKWNGMRICNERF